ncbi:hypothetical protein [Aurantimonas sp. VKM B-3413]|uniref:hypothetical protein n=1 Tax=Aurantimonas sp. VKM B-3413 TaxID=2779401 RepID=UPI001E3B6085|nr:hypothetical protein [Aurantimonas sp. VKM B-3413]MCB8837709.1 hypothetical protein [Aurantimonas sp. VKM B-3413]
MAHSKMVVDHDEIRSFAEKTGGKPSLVADTENSGKGPGVLRFDHGRDNDGLEEISWDRFFEIFEEQELALMLDDSGDNPNFNKFVSRK